MSDSSPLSSTGSLLENEVGGCWVELLCMAKSGSSSVRLSSVSDSTIRSLSLSSLSEERGSVSGL